MSNHLALAIGNSRLHWAWFRDGQIQAVWDTPHLSAQVVQQLMNNQFDFRAAALATVAGFGSSAGSGSSADSGSSLPELWIASVVPEQAKLWETYPDAHFIGLDQVPILGMYPTFGLDRALTVWGAVVTLGAPALVIDAGTALTFTGVDAGFQLVGGAILPGLGLQFRSLNQETAALPLAKLADAELPSRWALDTEGAIASGILFTVLAGIESFIQDWGRRFPRGAVVVTGGDGDRLYQLLKQSSPNLSTHLVVNPNLIFSGLQALHIPRSNSPQP